MMTPDEDLIRELQQGRSQAFDELFARYQRPVFHFCLRMTGSRPDAEDVTSEVFLALFQKCRSYEPKAKFSTWLFTIARNMSISRIRRRRKISFLWFIDKTRGDEMPWDIPDPSPGADEKAVRAETDRAIAAAIQKLPDLQKQALILREYQQFSYAEISQILKCSLEQVKILIYRARQTLKDQLAGILTEGSDE